MASNINNKKKRKLQQITNDEKPKKRRKVKDSGDVNDGIDGNIEHNNNGDIDGNIQDNNNGDIDGNIQHNNNVIVSNNNGSLVLNEEYFDFNFDANRIDENNNNNKRIDILTHDYNNKDNKENKNDDNDYNNQRQKYFTFNNFSTLNLNAQCIVNGVNQKSNYSLTVNDNQLFQTLGQAFQYIWHFDHFDSTFSEQKVIILTQSKNHTMRLFDQLKMNYLNDVDILTMCKGSGGFTQNSLRSGQIFICTSGKLESVISAPRRYNALTNNLKAVIQLNPNRLRHHDGYSTVKNELSSDSWSSMKIYVVSS